MRGRGFDLLSVVDLAACYRLVDLFGWSDLINPASRPECRGRTTIS
jgi:hypothetical protein